ncbi:MAG: ABC transporter substrate-binding protein [Chloroflexi bacterium]|nr:ABC transporter substrate-binding protein [Chloroflexota bacterium]
MRRLGWAVLLGMLVSNCRPAPTPPPITIQPASSTPTPPPLQRVRVVHTPSMEYAPLYVALERGFFRERGLALELTPISTTTEALAQLATGAVDVAALSLSANVFNVLARDLGVRIIASGGAWGPRSPAVLLVRRPLLEERQVTKLEDLYQRPVAYAGGPGSPGEYLLNSALERDRVSVLTVNVVDLPVTDHLAALRAGTVDASLTPEPFATAAVQQDVGRVLLRDWLLGAATGAYLASGQFRTNRAAAATAFLAALIEGARAIQGARFFDPDNLETYQRYTGVSAAQLRSDPPLVYDRTMAIARQSVADQERFFRDFRRTTYTTLLPLETYIDERFRNEALTLLAGR